MAMETQAKLAVQNAKARMGAGWDVLSDELQKALILAEAVSIVQVQDLEKYAAAQSFFDAVQKTAEEGA